MNVLAVVHSDTEPAGTFPSVVEERGHRLDIWRPDLAGPPAAEGYGAVLVFGGGMHVDQETEHPWLAGEQQYIGALLGRDVPVLGVCLGAQLVAKAAGASVGPATRPEIGWCEVERTGDDPVLDVLPARFPAFQWHFYAFEVPARGVELARSSVCPQAFRLRESIWGVQFHPEVTSAIVASWIDEDQEDAPASLLAETNARIDEWERLGRSLCSAFLAVAEERMFVRSVA